MSEQVKTDRRIVRTKRAIRNAFAQLLAQKNLNDITIKDIADLADINRKTVYSYYGGIHAILDEIENDFVAKVESVISDPNFSGGLENPYPIFEKLTAIINSDFEFLSKLMRMEANTQLIRKVINTIKRRMAEALYEQSSHSHRKIDLICDYVTSGLISAYQSWFNSDRSQSIEELSKELSMLVSYGVKGLLNGK
jgi:AcrR family transcriptional regulator